ncbi:MAG TPA: hypothetical protein VNJ51_14910 [Candidatus Dormibacteraeota bacterium]|nr:hypothetical protein [Candidatus Dormibacteraeota bacterium]
MSAEPRLVLDGVWLWGRRMVPGIPMTSALVRGLDGTLVAIDPVAPAGGWETLASIGKPAATVLTTHWHERESATLRARYGTPVWAGPEPDGIVARRAHFHLSEEGPLPGGFRAIPLGGTSPGEWALLLERDGGILFVGEALLALDVDDAPLGLGALARLLLPFGPPQPYPRWLAADPHGTDRDLERLASLRFEHVIVSHGFPWLVRADRAVRRVVRRTLAAHRRR